MPNNKLLAIVTIMVMVGSNAKAQQLFTIDELLEIESLISGKDCGALYSYLASNPKMTTGSDPLAAELRSFRVDVEAGRLDCFAPRSLSFQDASGDPRGQAQAQARGREVSMSIY